MSGKIKIFDLFVYIAIVFIVIAAFLSFDGPEKYGQESITSSQQSLGPATAEKKRKVKKVAQTSACEANGMALGKVTLPKKMVRKIMKKPVKLFLPAADENCIRKGDSVALDWGRLEKNDYRFFVSRPIGKVRVVKIREVSIAKGYKKLKKMLPKFQRRRWAQLLKTIKQKPSKQVYILTLEKVEINPMATRGAPFVHPYAKTVDAAEAEFLSQSGAFVADVRRKKLSKSDKIGWARHTPSRGRRKLRDAAYSFAKLESVNYKVRLPSRISQDTKIVVMGHHAGEYSGYNAITYLNGIGFKNLHWLRTGADSVKRRWTVPNWTDLPTIDLGDLLSQTRSGAAVLVDVRPGLEYQRGHIPGALSYPFRQKLIAKNVPRYRRKKFDLAQLRRVKESFQVNISGLPKDKKLVLIDKNFYSWSALKAFYFLKGSGFQNVEVFPGGYSEWHAHRMLSPGKFRISKNGQKKRKGSRRSAKNKDAVRL